MERIRATRNTLRNIASRAVVAAALVAAAAGLAMLPGAPAAAQQHGHGDGPDDDVWIAPPGASSRAASAASRSASNATAPPPGAVPARAHISAQASGRTLWRRHGDARTREIGPGATALPGAALPPLAEGDVYAASAYVLDLERGAVLYAKNDDQVRPIASITKLMSALVVLEARQPLDETLAITPAEAALPASSRLVVGTRLTREELLHLALMSSENRAAQALARAYPGGVPAFVAAMNAKAAQLAMRDTRFAEPTGLSSGNVSSPRDLVRLMLAAEREPLIRRTTTHGGRDVRAADGMQSYRNTNALVGAPGWAVTLSKTGYTGAAGRCLVMLATMEGRRIAFVLLGSADSESRLADGQRLRRYAAAALADGAKADANPSANTGADTDTSATPGASASRD